jgi:high-affinity Fe2+/Pb2+ permease
MEVHMTIAKSKPWAAIAVAICLILVTADVIWISSSTNGSKALTLTTFLTGAVAGLLLVWYAFACRRR